MSSAARRILRRHASASTGWTPASRISRRTTNRAPAPGARAIFAQSILHRTAASQASEFYFAADAVQAILILSTSRRIRQPILRRGAACRAPTRARAALGAPPQQLLAAVRLARAHGRKQLLHAPAQSVQLIDEVKNHRDAVIVHAEVLAQIADELRAGEIDVRERKLGVGLRRDQPSGGDPGLQRAVIEASAYQEFLRGDHSSLQSPTGIMLLSGLPAAGKFLDLRVELLRQHDLERDVFIAPAAVLARDALASQAQHPSGVRPL